MLNFGIVSYEAMARTFGEAFYPASLCINTRRTALASMLNE